MGPTRTLANPTSPLQWPSPVTLSTFSIKRLAFQPVLDWRSILRPQWEAGMADQVLVVTSTVPLAGTEATR